MLIIKNTTHTQLCQEEQVQEELEVGAVDQWVEEACEDHGVARLSEAHGEVEEACEDHEVAGVSEAPGEVGVGSKEVSKVDADPTFAGAPTTTTTAATPQAYTTTTTTH